MKLIFHGGAREVGKSCIELQTGKNRFLLDAGLKFKEGGFEYPKVVEIGNIDGVFLTHAHLDHSGALPMLENRNLNYPIFTTAQTMGLIKILLKDSYKISRIRRLHRAYEKQDLFKVREDIRRINFDRTYTHKNLKFKFYNAGHIPGGASIKITSENKTILYTGDFNTKGSELIQPADTNYGHVDFLICESTYGNRKLSNRKLLEKKFIQTIKTTLKRGGSVLIPSFAVGRYQDILLMLAKEKFNVPIFIDGMGKKVTNMVLTTHSKYVKNKELLGKIFNQVTHVGSETMRQKALSQQSIILTTSGMMQGGPVLRYLSDMWGEKKHSILLMGFQCKRTNGRHLLEDGYIYIDGWKTFPKCQIEKFDFSGHLDSEEIKKVVLKTKPKHLIFNHGDPESVQTLADWAKENTSCKVYSPAVGDILEF